jgi:Tol biopolymer transport system component
MVDTDASWSPDGTKILFTRFRADDNPQTPTSAEVFHINPDGTGLTQLTFNDVEERAPSWSNDGTRITYMCKQGPTVPNGLDNELCVMNADGTGQTQLTFNTLNDATSSFSPDDQKIIFHRGGQGTGTQTRVINPDGTGDTQITFPPGISQFPDWGFVRR